MRQFLLRSLPGPTARWHAAVALAFIAALAAELFLLQTFATTEARLGDRYLQRHAAQYRADPDIVIVDIDDASIGAMLATAGLWSWPREIHADLLEGLASFHPRAVVFDIAFSERDVKRPRSDARLSQAVAAMPQVYLAAARLSPALDANGAVLGDLAGPFGVARHGAAGARAALLLPHALDAGGWRLGLTNSIEDGDGVLRRYRLYMDIGGWHLPSLPARVAAALGTPLPDSAEFLLHWPHAGHKRFAYGELYRVLTEQRAALSPQEVRTLDALFRDKIVVIGASATSLFDHHVTPLDAGYPGVDVLAVAIDNLKNGGHIRIVSPLWPLALGAVLIAALGVAFARRINPLLVSVALALLSGAALAAADAAIGRNLWLPVATPLLFAWAWFLCAAIAGYLRERRTRDQAVSLFRRFLNPNVVRQIVEQGETVESLSGRTREITVLFSDIRGFTTLSESRPPHEVVALLNRYFEKQVEVVFRHGGTLDKFIGDCIMAIWGAPLEDASHARHAVDAALEMQENLLAFRRELEDEGSDVGDFDVGIGVHTGPAVVGFIGAQRKLDYTAIGDTVNLASRVEGLTKGVARVLVTRETMQACGSAFEFIHHGAFAVKGRSAQVDLYEPRRTT
ncbi:adenylate/guanylate cyclase domain-containing protein [Noviherbaspirillum autotrophicum]|uniref:adenylate/guanylate cyclase domain-containing protein n=1 Tax=Noviherbaspirillum autotrophicum TaxID=709839 RepID=UPI000694050D|nr:adenylate/guanylate cyclase domain-containing protein [Noviherbaspirillum autotrophicum]